MGFLSLQLERCVCIIGTPREVASAGPARQRLSVTAYCACAYLLSRPAYIISTPTRGLHIVPMVLIYTKSARYTAYASIHLEGSEKVTGSRLVNGH